MSMLYYDTTPKWAKEGRPQPRSYGFRQMRVGEVMRVPVAEQTCTWRLFYINVKTTSSRTGMNLIPRLADNGDFEVYRSA